MAKPLYFALLLVAASGLFTAQAQTTDSGRADAAAQPGAARPLNKNYLTSSGETVSHPGQSQGAATTDLDRRIEQENNRLEQNICSNCK
ncbi:MAG TPA: hypothetical protein VL996_03925 [Methylocella sp.]|nr:hypothetical protein [Methylocella sp.]